LNRLDQIVKKNLALIVPEIIKLQAELFDLHFKEENFLFIMDLFHRKLFLQNSEIGFEVAKTLY